MVQTAKVQFREQSKGVIAETSFESDELSPDKVLEQSIKLFDDAMKHSRVKTLEKLR